MLEAITIRGSVILMKTSTDTIHALTDIIIQEITDREQWNTFVSQSNYVHLMQSYEWGELNQYLGAHVYRLGALQNGQLIGAMQLHVVTIPIPVLRINYLYSIRGPVV